MPNSTLSIRGLIFLSAWLVIGVWPVAAQEMRIDQIDASMFPQVALYSTVVDENGAPIADIKDEAWQLLEDGAPSKAVLKITPFPFTEEGVAVAVVLGASGIMKGQPLESEKIAAINLASKLQIKDRADPDKMAVLAYGDRVETISKFDATEDDRRQQIKKLQSFGNTVTFYDALWQALQALSQPGLPKRKAIVIVSDGRDNGSTVTYDEVLEKMKSSNIPVYGVGFTLISDKYLGILQKFCKVSGGYYFYAVRETQINPRFQDILEQIKHSYLMQFNSKRIPGDRQIHQLTLKVTARSKSLASTKSFLAKKNPLTTFQLVMRIVIVALIVLVIVALLLWYFLAPIPGFKRKCPQCKRIMQDEWDECHFCKYMPLYPKEVLKNKK